MKKHLLAVALFLVGLYFCFLAFNHIDAWIGLAAVALDIFLLIHYFEKQFKKRTNEKV